MKKETLFSISPLDGRYIEKLYSLGEYFSEFALFRYRILVEVEYFIALSELGLPNFQRLTYKEITDIRRLYNNFTKKDAKKIKKIEQKTNHDIKAVEYFIKQSLKKTSLEDRLEYIHFGLTSQDINNTAIPLMIRDALKDQYIPELNSVVTTLKTLAQDTKDVAMLARTHGQVASPTTLGKEIFVFAHRLKIQSDKLISLNIVGKFGGATGNLNAHYIAFPKINWMSFADKLLKKIGLTRNPVTTQIDSYDNIAEICDVLRRINIILIDLDRDVWQYISRNYFIQRTIKNEVGSSAMPHKVNPIDFENSEGNLGVANSLLTHFSTKLPISRLQRDLTDSTVLRNIGVPFGHSILAFKSLQKGLSKLEVNKGFIAEDLENHWEVTAEAIQTILRREQMDMPYEKLKKLTRGKKVTKKIIEKFINKLKIDDNVKDELLKITPENYIGIASKLVD